MRCTPLFPAARTAQRHTNRSNNFTPSTSPVGTITSRHDERVRSRSSYTSSPPLWGILCRAAGALAPYVANQSTWGLGLTRGRYPSIPETVHLDGPTMSPEHLLCPLPALHPGGWALASGEWSCTAYRTYKLDGA